MSILQCCHTSYLVTYPKSHILYLGQYSPKVVMFIPVCLFQSQNSPYSAYQLSGRWNMSLCTSAGKLPNSCLPSWVIWHATLMILKELSQDLFRIEIRLWIDRQDEQANFWIQQQFISILLFCTDIKIFFGINIDYVAWLSRMIRKLVTCYQFQIIVILRKYVKRIWNQTLVNPYNIRFT